VDYFLVHCLGAAAFRLEVIFVATMFGEKSCLACALIQERLGNAVSIFPYFPQ
jgi:hypothetical protein